MSSSELGLQIFKSMMETLGKDKLPSDAIKMITLIMEDGKELMQKADRVKRDMDALKLEEASMQGRVEQLTLIVQRIMEQAAKEERPQHTPADHTF